MKRLGLVLACVAVLALLALPAAASAAYTTSAECLGCHAPAGAGAITKVDFSTASGAGAVDYAACNACHNAATYDFIGNFYHGHVNDYGPVCTNCHSTYQGVGDIGRVPLVNLGASGNFASASSLTKSPAELHAIHVNGSWEKTLVYRGGICQGCHAPAACSSCHAGAVPHATHSATAFGAVSYTVAVGQPYNALTPGLRTDTVNCVNASCHALAAAATPAFKPFCGDGTCHKPPVDTADRTIEHGYDPTMHTSAWTLGTSCGGVGCHVPGQRDLMDVHNNFRTAKDFTCAGCHGSTDTNVKAAIAGHNTACDACHPNANLTTGHYTAHEAVPALVNAGGTGNYAYYTGTTGGSPTADCAATGCHVNNLMDEHDGRLASDGTPLGCASCHSSTSPNVVTAIMAGVTKCDACHTVHGPIATLHASTFSDAKQVPCEDCHSSALQTEHASKSVTVGTQVLTGCALCHDYFAGARGAQVQAAIAAPDTKCTACHTFHTDTTTAHTTTNTSVNALECSRCHDSGPEAGTNVLGVHAGDRLGACAVCHENHARVPDITAKTPACSSCHDTAGTTYHRSMETSHTYAGGVDSCDGASCHSLRLETEHTKYLARYKNTDGTQTYPDSCALCHQNATPGRIDWSKATAECTTCHATTHPKHLPTASAGCLGSGCHGTTGDLLPLHAARTEGACAVCHSNPTKGNLTIGKTTFDCDQSGCHPTSGGTFHVNQDASHTATQVVGTCTGSDCHVNRIDTEHAKWLPRFPTYTTACALCHANTNPTRIPVNANADCYSCHTTTHPRHIAASSAACLGSTCHGVTGDLFPLHYNNAAGPCSVCHNNPTKGDVAAGKTTFECAQSGCHSAEGHPAHVANNSASCIGTGCHATATAGDVMQIHAARTEGKCAVCHSNPTKGNLTTGKTTFDCAQTGCHTAAGHPAHIANNSATCIGAGCHATATPGDVMQIHAASTVGKCAVCHSNPTKGDVTVGKTVFDCNQSGCHAGATGDHHTLHNTTGKIDAGCVGCHYAYLDDEHSKLGFTCDTCHASTNKAVQDAISVNNTVACSACHPAVNGKNRHAALTSMQFTAGNTGGHNALGMSFAKTSFKVGTSTYTWPLPTTFLKTGWTSTSAVTCDKCHTFSSTLAGPHGSAVTVNMDPAYTGVWKTAYLSGSSSGSGASSNIICVKCHTNFTPMNQVHNTGDHNGSSDGKCVGCHSQIPHGWRLPRLLAYKTDPAPYNSLYLTGISLKSYTPSNWSKSNCAQSGCGEHSSSISGAWPSTLQLPAGTLTGYVRNSAGVAISGATVAVTGDGSTTTDATGKYTLSLAQGAYTITASASGYVAASQANVAVTSAQTTALDFSLVAAQTVGTLTGKVTDSGAHAISGVTVSVAGKTATTDSNGNYTITGVASGSQSVTFSMTGYTTQTKTVTVTANQTTTLNATLVASPTSTGTLTGQVTDSNRRSISGVTVSVAGKTATTDSSGRYTITGIAAGTYTATYSKSGYRSSSQSVTITSGQTTTKNVQLSSSYR